MSTPYPTATPRGRGRPPIPPEDRQVTVSFRLPPADALKFHALGGKDWLSERLRRAASPKEATQ